MRRGVRCVPTRAGFVIFLEDMRQLCHSHAPRQRAAQAVGRDGRLTRAHGEAERRATRSRRRRCEQRTRSLRPCAAVRSRTTRPGAAGAGKANARAASPALRTSRGRPRVNCRPGERQRHPAAGRAHITGGGQDASTQISPQVRTDPARQCVFVPFAGRDRDHRGDNLGLRRNESGPVLH